MKQLKIVRMLAVLATIVGATAAIAQYSHPTASRELQLSAFGAASGVYTGLSGGRNVSFTAGGDLGLPPFRGVRPIVEVRGTYPVHGGTIDSQKSVLGGLKVEFLLNHRFRPYGDFLFGRGQINYPPSGGLNGYFFRNQIYALTTTYIYSPGAGFDYLLNQHFAIKVDGQYQRWGSAPTPSGTIYSKVGTVGLVYYFTFDHRRR